MDMINNLIDYASHLELITDLEVNDSNVSFILDDVSYEYDLSYQDDYKRITKKLRSLLPITEVIDLIKESISLGIVTDCSLDYNKNQLLDYESYVDITNAGVFAFEINNETFEDTIYNITFNKSEHDIKRKIEYASRTSEFVDTLMKRIMAKYNILLVRKANFDTNIYPKMKESKYYTSDFVSMLDTDLETNMTQNELKVLVNYRDNFNNTSCSLNVIDDIYISLNGSDVSYGFYNVKQAENEPIYDVINETIDSIDIDSLLRIKNLIADPEVKFNIFETLRGNKDTNLYSLLENRMKEYDKSLNQEPKVEFTITPLSIYCNHIVEKSCIYHLTSVNPAYKDYGVDYEITYNPTNIDEIYYKVDIDGDIEKLKDIELVLAYNDVPGEDRDIHGIVTTLDYAVMLYGLNDKFKDDIYKDVYFLKESLVKLHGGVLEPFDGVVDGFTYLKSQVVKGELTGEYYYIGEATRLNPSDILGTLVSEEKKYAYVHNNYVRKCEVCGHSFGATLDVWDMYKSAHQIINSDEKKSCCDCCSKEDDNYKYSNKGLSIIYSKGQRKYFYDDLKNISNTDICISCENKEDALLFVNPKSRVNSAEKCIVCKRYYCPTHINAETHMCNNCSGDVKRSEYYELDKKIRNRINVNLNAIDLVKKGLKYYRMEDANALWVYSDTDKQYKVYYLISNDDAKFIHLEKVYRIKR